MNKRKFRVLAATYTAASVLALGLYGGVKSRGLEGYRLAADFASSRAFEETVYAVDALSESLKKSAYATDGGMCAGLCGEIYANASAAEAAMSILPFSTHELEQLSAFLNTAGDYAHSLSFTADDGFEGEETENLAALSEVAADFAEMLRQLRGDVNNGAVLMDRREEPLINVGVDDETAKLSEVLLDYEKNLQPAESFEYDGKYSKQKPDVPGNLNEEERKSLAAQYAGVSPGALKLEYEYEGSEGRQCYSVDGLMICVSPEGVASMGQSRLVESPLISLEEAEAIGKKFIDRMGFEDVELSSLSENGGLALMVFTKTEDGAICADNYIKLAVAMDDGSIYSFNAEHYDSAESGARWLIDEETAAKTLPAGLELLECQRVILESGSGESLACYRLNCRGEGEELVNIYLDAQSGKQRKIELL